MTESSDELRVAYQRLLAAVHELDAFAGFCYTQLTDTFQEANGLFTADRRPKFALEAMSRATLGLRPSWPEVHIDARSAGPETRARPEGREMPAGPEEP